jgi:hypothetical protein
MNTTKTENLSPRERLAQECNAPTHAPASADPALTAPTQGDAAGGGKTPKEKLSAFFQAGGVV